MPTSAALRQTPISASFSDGKTITRKPISWKDFQRRFLRREDGFKYEWVDEGVVKSVRTMDKTQLFILENLLEFFDRLKSAGQADGRLISEPDLFFLENHRRPDVAWLTREQIYRLADKDAYEVPAFVVEVISTNDQIILVEKKMDNYRDAGVKVVWQIYPSLRKVNVYSGERLSQMIVCKGDAICSAAAAIPDFQMAASSVFKLQ